MDVADEVSRVEAIDWPPSTRAVRHGPGGSLPRHRIWANEFGEDRHHGRQGAGDRLSAGIEKALITRVAEYIAVATGLPRAVERISLDLQRLLTPEKLTVFARYVRRGGLDINPYRSTGSGTTAEPPPVRQ